MGLDMYLTKKTYVQNWDHMSPEELHQITVLKNGKPVEHIIPKRISYIVEEVGYWRKENHIHQWFVDNVQNGNDDCGDYYVSLEQLDELLDTCKKVLEDHDLASELLPTQEGFFFGGTEYDEWYFNGIESTVKIIEKIMELERYTGDDPRFKYHGYATYHYHSSW